MVLYFCKDTVEIYTYIQGGASFHAPQRLLMLAFPLFFVSLAPCLDEGTKESLRGQKTNLTDRTGFFSHALGLGV